jgi:anti-sigma factor RsiW
VDHNVTPKERQAIESHLIACFECRQTVALVIKSQTVVPDPPLPKPLGY